MKFSGRIRAAGAPPSHRGHRGRGRADGAGQAQGRRGEQEAGPAVLPEPGGEFAQVPQLAQVHAELEQAVLVQGQRPRKRPGAAGAGDPCSFALGDRPVL